MSDPKPVLYIGPQNYSSWSIRPWLVLKWSGIDFETIIVNLDAEGYGQKRIKDVLEISPSGTVPALKIDDFYIWDSLAISEWANEQAPEAGLWPIGEIKRAIARSITCEMHSGFENIRNHLPHNIRRRVKEQIWDEATKIEIARLDYIWSDCLGKFGGPYLFGNAPTIADAFYAPMAVRMRTYNVTISEIAAKYRDFILSTPEFLQWAEEAEKNWKPFNAGPWDSIYE